MSIPELKTLKIKMPNDKVEQFLSRYTVDGIRGDINLFMDNENENIPVRTIRFGDSKKCRIVIQNTNKLLIEDMCSREDGYSEIRYVYVSVDFKFSLTFRNSDNQILEMTFNNKEVMDNFVDSEPNFTLHIELDNDKLSIELPSSEFESMEFPYTQTIQIPIPVKFIYENKE